MKILVAEDDRITRALLTRWVAGWGYEAVVVENGSQALEVLLTDPGIQLAVLDWMMPGKNGPDICREVRERRPEPYCYITLLTSKTDTNDVVKGLEAGADDYVVKPCNPLELEVRLRVGRRLVQLQKSLIAAREQLRNEATHDALTGLLNRRAIMDKLVVALAVAREESRPMSVVMMDIDHFKNINDGFGHAAGDRVLSEVARRIQSELGEGHVVGRYGGEEFLAVLQDCELARAREVAERVREAIAREPIPVGAQSLGVTSSLGVACSKQFARGDEESLVRGADGALYRSKREGRNRVTMAELREFGRQSLPVSFSVFPSSSTASHSDLPLTLPSSEIPTTIIP